MVQGLEPLPDGKADEKMIIGLTGGFGTGKSTVSGLLADRGAFTADADKIAHEALRKGCPVFEKTASLFPEAHNPEGTGLDRRRIAEVVFADPARRQALEEVIHPYVLERLREEVRRASEKICVLEVPLLFEAGFEKICDLTIAVSADEQSVLKRLEEKGVKAESVRARWKAQMPMEEKKARADFVIDNSHNLGFTKKQTEEVWKKIESFLKGAH